MKRAIILVIDSMGAGCGGILGNYPASGTVTTPTLGSIVQNG